VSDVAAALLLDGALRPSGRRLLGRLAALTASALLGFMAISATRSEAAILDPSLAALPAPAPDPVAAMLAALEPRTTLGYLRGHRRPIEIVTLGDVDVELATARAFLAMRAAAAASGVELALESGFRTRAEQADLYRAYRRGRGNKAARPGRSNHQSGRALDISVADPTTRAWMTANAASFGFARTVRSEPWHWEYVKAPKAHDGRRVKHGKAKKAKAKAKRRG
jgi:hypothetical protein